MSLGLRFASLLALVLTALCSAPARAAVKEMDAPSVRQLASSEPKGVLLLDVRTPREYAEVRIPGSVPIPINDVPKRLAEIPKEKKIIVICASGVRSAAVARYLDQVGYPWVANYGGGVADWVRRGLPVER